MQDKYINATKLIERLKCEKRREVAEAASNPFSTGPAPEIRISQIYDGVGVCSGKGTGGKCGSAPCSKVADMPELR